MQIKLLKDIVSSIVGQSSAKIVDLLHDKKNVNEFLIAKKLKLTINQTRNILYRLADEGLVSFVRKKDSKKGGWYTYFWTLNTGKSLVKFRDKLALDIGNLKQNVQIKKSRTFYYCSNCNLEYTEENALLNNYTCSECGEILQLKDNSSEILAIEKDIVKLQNLLNEVNLEVGEIEKKEQKVKDRRLKAEVKKKVVERAKRKQERLKEMKKMKKLKEKRKAKNKKIQKRTKKGVKKKRKKK